MFTTINIMEDLFFRMLCNNESLKIPKNLQEMFNLRFQSFYSVPVPAT